MQLMMMMMRRRRNFGGTHVDMVLIWSAMVPFYATIGSEVLGSGIWKWYGLGAVCVLVL